MPEDHGLARASNASREIRSVRDLIILAVIEMGAQYGADIAAEYEMRTREFMSPASIYRNLARLRKFGLVRYASSGADLHPVYEKFSKGKYHVLTGYGREVLDRFRRAIQEVPDAASDDFHFH